MPVQESLARREAKDGGPQQVPKLVEGQGCEIGRREIERGLALEMQQGFGEPVPIHALHQRPYLIGMCFRVWCHDFTLYHILGGPNARGPVPEVKPSKNAVLSGLRPKRPSIIGASGLSPTSRNHPSFSQGDLCVQDRAMSKF